MALSSDDSRPVGISIRDAYRAIRAWYQANADFDSDPQMAEHAAASKAYVLSLPSAEKATRDEMIDALRRVIYRDLEWAYHQSDGKYKMAAYAEAAFKTEGVSPIAAD
jgi:hypothetical protein